MSILIVSDKFMAGLNEQYLGKKGPTDVISFPQGEQDAGPLHVLGDVVISLDTAVKMAKENSVSLQNELDFYLIHGILHLLGHDHEGDRKQAALMMKLQKSLLEELNALP